ncbi:MAG: CehA/McbA family metallohydrolase [Candidatus Methylacidiphilales bacterium]|nr:PHP domain-containing protein [Candidatus Methylacidiphilales bacterium]
MLLNFDLHCHSRYSADGVAEPEDLIAEARRKGLHGFAITDHDTCECVDYFMRHGYMNALGTPVNGFLIIPGQEISTSDGHLLGLGVRLPSVRGISAANAVNLIHRSGGIAIPPHPYDFFRAGIREHVLNALPIDGLEVFNAATTLKRYNQQAYDYAQRRGLPMTSSSDAHDAVAIGTAMNTLQLETFDVAGVLAAVTRGSNTLTQRYLTPRDALKKTWNNVFRLRRKRREPVEPPVAPVS